MLRTRWFYVTVLPIACFIAALTFATAFPGSTDDAFILLVYIRHFAESGRFFWNLEDGAVDGFTSVLDLLVKAAFYKVFGGDLVRLNGLVTAGLVVAGGVVSAVTTERLCRKRNDGCASVIAIVGTIALVANRSAMDGASFLLETPLYLAMVMAGCATWLLVKEWTRPLLVALGVEWALVALARPEGLALAACFLVAFAIATRKWIPLGTAAVLLGGYTAWHTLHFGYWAPNTFYAKTSSVRLNEISDGLLHARIFARSRWGALSVLTILASPALALSPRWVDKTHRARFLLLSGLGVVSFASVVYAGGDTYLGWARFFACATMLAMLACIYAALFMQGRMRLLAMAPLVAFALGNIVGGVRALPVKMDRIARWPLDGSDLSCDIEAGRALEAFGIRTFAQTDYQRLKYVNDRLRVIDATGLNDVTAAHTPESGHVWLGKGLVPHALRTRAEAFSFGFRLPLKDRPMARFTSLELLYDHPTRETYLASKFEPPLLRHQPPYGDFTDAAAMRDAFLPASFPVCGRWFNVWLRNDVAERLRDDVMVGRREPEHVLPLDDGPSVRYENFDPVESSGPLRFRWSRGRGVVHLRDLPKVEGRRCSLGIVTGTGSSRFTASYDGAPLSRIPFDERVAEFLGVRDSARHALPDDFARAGQEHELVIESLPGPPQAETIPPGAPDQAILRPHLHAPGTMIVSIFVDCW
jgi:hypothetical protein